MTKKILIFSLILALLVSMLPVSAADVSGANIIYVAPYGKDTNKGSIDSPLATLDAAKKQVRKLKEKGVKNIEVVFREGDYHITKAVEFTAADSGKADDPIVYRSYEGDINVIGVIVDLLMITTMDNFHYEPLMKALEIGYKNILLEKPLSPSMKECIEMTEAAQKHNANVIVLHSLRYGLYWRKLREIVDSGEIGKVMGIRHVEGASVMNYSHSFVRGNWENTKDSAPFIDFYGQNIYNGKEIKAGADGKPEYVERRVGSPKTAIQWPITPECLHWAPKFFYDRYKLPIYITENGMSAHDVVSLDGKVHDPNRIDFLNRYLLELEKSTDEGADIAGYFLWSFIDNFEWSNGYTDRFGIVYVDYETQKRIPKDSAYWYKEWIEEHGK